MTEGDIVAIRHIPGTEREICMAIVASVWPEVEGLEQRDEAWANVRAKKIRKEDSAGTGAIDSCDSLSAKVKIIDFPRSKRHVTVVDDFNASRVELQSCPVFGLDRVTSALQPYDLPDASIPMMEYSHARTHPLIVHLIFFPT